MSGVRRLGSRLPLRVRLVAGFSVVMLVLLTAAGAFVYWRVEYALDRGLDTELASAASVIAPLVGADGTVAPRDAADATGVGWQVLAHDGTVLDWGGPASATPLVSESRLDQVGESGVRTFDVGSLLPAADTPYRVRVEALPETGAGTVDYLLVGVRRDHRDEALRELLLQLTIAGLGALVIASVVGDQLARLALRPVERYRSRAAEIATGAAHLRLDVPEARDDEVTRLGHTLNEMLASLEEALDRERQFVNDASHELRTPLTLLKSRIQLTRRRVRSVEEHEAALDELAVDVARLAELAEQLLDLSRETEPRDAVGDLAGAAEGVVRRWGEAHPDRPGDVTVEVPGGATLVPVDPHALERIVTNLLANALTHGRPPVRIRVRREGDRAIVEVVDDGPGMPPDLLAQATRRFSRAPEARSRPGAGLGLSIVEHLVTAAGGELRLCYRAHHVATGARTDLPCRHDDRMTVTVLLPATEQPVS
ncbi:HAMP domain-containing histidine kinase [Nocardioides sp. LMS-CY]|uniref:sensor histidine kinase n=1 Tax=Nocardioides sp. (strain LMS-CY) TaxID=2840457 RepID=UPI001BFFDCD2|nr:HAMP domain-containing sensor histidine kinase [Nocardioides sp. LMS-CY]QWF20609.1 HAMP domain-containing histidine kinase [Nocardioides sp. LMS-CY]